MTAAVKSTTTARETLPMSAWAGSPWAKYLYWLGRLFEKLSFGHARLHIYLFCAQPIGSGAFDAMRTGYVDEAWAKEHHEYWYNDVKAGKLDGEGVAPVMAQRTV